MPKGSKLVRSGSNYIQYTCLECGYKTRSVTGYKLHVRKSHDREVGKEIEEEVLTCGVCGNQYNANSQLKDHLKKSGHYYNQIN